MKPTTLGAFLTVLGSVTLSGGVAAAQQQLFQQPQSVSLQTASGMLLGVYANTTPQGLKIVGTIPGYSAEGRLFAGDVLTQATSAGMPVYSIRSHSEMEYAKSQIGPFREAAVEFFRPGVGLMYAWVTFQPIGGSQPQLHAPQPALGGAVVLNGANSGQPGFNPGPFPTPNNGNPNNVVMKSEIGNPNNVTPRNANPRGGPGFNPNNSVARSEFSGPAASEPGKFKAEFLLESEKPGARLLFRKPVQSQSTSAPVSPFTSEPGPIIQNPRFPQGGRPQTNVGPGGFPRNTSPQSTESNENTPQLGPLQQRVQELKRQQRGRTFGQ